MAGGIIQCRIMASAMVCVFRKLLSFFSEELKLSKIRCYLINFANKKI